VIKEWCCTVALWIVSVRTELSFFVRLEFLSAKSLSNAISSYFIRHYHSLIDLPILPILPLLINLLWYFCFYSVLSLVLSHLPLSASLIFYISLRLDRFSFFLSEGSVKLRGCPSTRISTNAASSCTCRSPTELGFRHLLLLQTKLYSYQRFQVLRVSLHYYWLLLQPGCSSTRVMHSLQMAPLLWFRIMMDPRL
jgi:hypothetical protein